MAIEPPRPTVPLRGVGRVVWVRLAGPKGEDLEEAFGDTGGSVGPGRTAASKNRVVRRTARSAGTAQPTRARAYTVCTPPLGSGGTVHPGRPRLATLKAGRAGSAALRSMASLSADAPSGEGGEVVTKLNFNPAYGGASYSAEALEAAVVAHGATVTEIDLT